MAGWRPISKLQTPLDFDPISGQWTNRLSASVDRYQANMYGIAEAMGSEWAGERRRANEAEAEFRAEQARRQGAVSSYKDVDGLGSALNYVGGLFVDSSPYLVEALAGGGVAGMAARGLGLGVRGVSAARAAGTVGASYPSAVGDVLSAQREQAGTMDLPSAAALGVPYAALNLLGVEGALGRGQLFRNTISALDDISGWRGVAARAGTTAGITGLSEGASETGQEMLNQAGRMVVDPIATFTDPAALERYGESFVGGAVLGGGMAAGLGGWRRSAGYEPQNLLQGEAPVPPAPIAPEAPPFAPPENFDSDLGINPYDVGGFVTRFRETGDAAIDSPQLGLFGGGGELTLNQANQPAMGPTAPFTPTFTTAAPSVPTAPAKKPVVSEEVEQAWHANGLPTIGTPKQKLIFADTLAALKADQIDATGFSEVLDELRGGKTQAAQKILQRSKTRYEDLQQFGATSTTSDAQRAKGKPAARVATPPLMPEKVEGQPVATPPLPDVNQFLQGGTANVSVPVAPGGESRGGSAAGGALAEGSVAAPGRALAPADDAGGVPNRVQGPDSQVAAVGVGERGGAAGAVVPAFDPTDVQETREMWDEEVQALEKESGIRGLPRFDTLPADMQRVMIAAPRITKKDILDLAEQLKLYRDEQADAKVDDRERQLAAENIDVADLWQKIQSIKSPNMRDALRRYVGIDEQGHKVKPSDGVTAAAKEAGYKDHAYVLRTARALGLTDAKIARLHAAELPMEAPTTAPDSENDGTEGRAAPKKISVEGERARLGAQSWFKAAMPALDKLTPTELGYVTAAASRYQDNPQSRDALRSLFDRIQDVHRGDKRRVNKAAADEIERAYEKWSEASAETQQAYLRAIEQRLKESKGKDVQASLSEADKRKETHDAESLEDALLSFIEEDSLGRQVIIVDTAADLNKYLTPKQIDELIETERGGKRPMAIATDGKAYFIADRVPIGEERGVFLHEVGAHLGAERFLKSSEFRGLVNQIRAWARGDGETAEMARRAIARAERSGEANTDPETLAYFVEEAVNAGVNPTAMDYRSDVGLFFRKLWAAFKQGLRKLGVKIDTLTPQDVVDLAYGFAKLNVKRVLTNPENRTSSSLQFSIANDTKLYDSTAERVRKEMPQRARDSMTTIKDRIQRHWPWFLTTYQLLEQYGGNAPGKIKTLKPFFALQQSLTVTRNQLSLKANELSVEWEKLRKAQPAMATAMEQVMKDATMKGVHPDRGFQEDGNEHLTEDQRADYTALKAKYDKLAPPAKAVYQKVLKALEADWKLRQESYGSLVDYSYQKRIDDARKAGDEARVEQLEKDRDGAKRDYERELKKIKGPYFPLVRFGEYMAVGKSKDVLALEQRLAEARGEYVPGGDENKEARTEKTESIKALERQLDVLKRNPAHYVVSMHETAGQRAKAMREMAAQGLEVEARLTDQQLDVARAISRDTLENIMESVRAQFDSDVSGQVNQSITQIFLRSLPEMHALHREAQRKGIEGASDDMLRAFAATSQQNAFYISRLQHASELADTLYKMKQEVRGNDKLSHVYREMEQRYALDMAYKRTPVQDLATSLSWIWHLAVSPSFVFINATQPYLVTAPMLAGRFGMAATSKHLGSAAADAVKILSRVRFNNGKWDPWSAIGDDVMKEFFPGEDGSKGWMERKALRELVVKGLLEEGQQHELNMYADDSSRKLAKANRLLGWSTVQIEMVNRLTAGLAAFRAEYEKTRNYQQAVDYSYKTTLASQFDYSQEGTARFMREGGGVPLAKIVFQFRKYQQAMLYALGSNLVRAVRQRGTAEGAEAAKTFGYFMLTSGLSAGAMGLPFAGVFFAVANAFMDDDDPRGDAEARLRNGLLAITGDKDIAAAVAKGLPALFGADVSARIGLGDVATPFPFARFDARTGGEEQVGELLRLAFGPTAGMAARFYDGMVRLGEGDLAKGLEKMSPKFVSDFIKAGRYAADGITDGKGAPTGTQLEPLDITLRGLGIAPIAETDYYEGTRAIKTAREGYMKREGLVARAYKEGVRDGDLSKARRMIDEFNRDHPFNRIMPKDELRWRQEVRKEGKGRAEGSGVKLGVKKDAYFNQAGQFALP